MVEQYRPRQSAYAVADAMMNVQAYHLDGSAQSALDVDIQLEQALGGGCKTESLRVIRYLAENYANLFTFLALISSRGSDREFKFERHYWGYHAYFLAKGKDGIYFAGSPANLDPDRDNLTRVFRSPDLAEVMKKIKDLEGSYWPDANFINSVMSSPNNSFQIDRSQKMKATFTVTEINGQADEQTASHLQFC